MEADLSEHLGRTGEFFIGVLGLLLLALMHTDVRRFLVRRISSVLAAFLFSHSALRRKSRFYADWVNAFKLVFFARNNLFLIVAALTGFDYLAGWHSEFMITRFSLNPDWQEISAEDYLRQMSATVFSAAYAFSLLRVVGYTLFSWLAFRVAAGETYKTAAAFRPLSRLTGLFLCIYAAEVFASAITPNFLLHGPNMIGNRTIFIFFVGGMIISASLGLLGLRLINTRLNTGVSKAAISALAGYVVIIHALQWIYYGFDLAEPSRIVFLRVAEYHASGLSFTILWNVALIAFAVRLSGPPLSTPASSAPFDLPKQTV